uniref:Uncharacterized protein n=1 Tax=Aegilops tauschii subsp. strangulata TaxID=200361 RepID=A0A453PX76_AEGTS
MHSCVFFLKSVKKNLSLGTEAFWLEQQRKSRVGFCARYDTKKMVKFFVLVKLFITMINIK